MVDLLQFYPHGVNANEGSLEQGGGGQLPVSGPEGLPVVIFNSEFAKDEKRDGFFYIKLHLRVVDGEFIGEEGSMIIYMVAPGEESWEKMGDKNLRLIGASTGTYFIQNTAELHEKPFRVVTKERHYTDQSGVERTGSKINKILDIDGNEPRKNESAAPQAQGRPQFAAPANQVTPATRQYAPKSAPASAPAAPAATGARPPFPFAKKG